MLVKIRKDAPARSTTAGVVRSWVSRMEASQAAGIDRRNFLKLAATLPLLGALGAIVSPLLRFLKPNIEPFRVYAPTAQDVPKGEQIIAATLSEVSRSPTSSR